MLIYKGREKYTRWGAVFQMVSGCAAHSSRQVLTRHPKPCSLVTLFTSSRSACERETLPGYASETLPKCG
jgi:hypothetical protein